MAASRFATIKVTGLRELIIRGDEAGKASKKLVREGLRTVAEPVRDEATRLWAASASKMPPAQRSAYIERADFRIYVRRAGMVNVEEARKRTTGKRPDFAGRQMRRALVPAAERKKDEVVMRMQREVERIARIFEGGV